mgnify:CR=1 FL=1
MTTVYLVRHAEAEGNLYRRVHGWYNSLITDNGYRQIAALRGRFADIHIDAVYSSDLFRTMTTAKAVYLSHGLELHTDPGLREIGLGAWEDKPWGELERCDAMNLIRFNHSSPDFRVEGGETFAQVQARLKGAVLRLAAAHPGQTIALFSHGTAIRCLQGALRGLGPGEMDGLGHSDNTAVTCLEVEGDTARIVFENDNSHLPDEISTLARQRWWKERDGTSGDANLWFRPLNLKKEGTVYRTARHEAWQDVNGPAVPFDGDAFQRDALRCWKRAPERAVMCAMQRDETAGLLQMDLDRGAAEPNFSVRNFQVFFFQADLRAVGNYRLAQPTSSPTQGYLHVSIISEAPFSLECGCKSNAIKHTIQIYRALFCKFFTATDIGYIII